MVLRALALACSAVGATVMSPGLAAAQADVAVAAAPADTARLTVPFSPPDGVALHYRITREAEGRDAPPKTVMEQQLTFTSRDDGGWLLRIETTSITVGERVWRPGDDLSDLPLQNDATALHAPVAVQLAPSGQIVRIDDWENFRKNLLTTPVVVPEHARRGGYADGIRKATRDMLRQASESPAGDMLGLSYPWQQLFGYGLMEFTLGQDITWSDMEEFMDGQAIVARDSTLTITPGDNGSLALTRELIVSPDGFAEAIDTARAGNDPQAQAQAAILEQYGTWVSDYDLITRAKLAIDPAGLLSDATLTITTERNSKVSTRIITTIQLIEPEAADLPPPAP